MKYIFFLLIVCFWTIAVSAQTIVPFDNRMEIDFIIESDQPEILYGDIGFVAESQEQLTDQLIVFVYSIDNILLKQIPLHSSDGGYRWQGSLSSTALIKGTYFFRLGIMDQNLSPIIWHAGFSREVIPRQATSQKKPANTLTVPVAPLPSRLIASSSAATASSSDTVSAAPALDSLWQALLASSTEVVAELPTGSVAPVSLWCQSQHLVDVEQCSVLEQNFMPKECRDTQVKSMDECDYYLRSLYIPAVCTDEQGQPSSCSQVLQSALVDKTDCGQTGGQLCRQILEERLGLLARRQKIVEVQKFFTHSSVSDTELEDWYGQQALGWSWPFSPNEQSDNYRIYGIQSAAAILADGQVKVLPAFVLSPDQDNDGLVDDAEIRYGSDTLVADTDHDSYSDGHEVANNYSPVATSSAAMTVGKWDKLLLSQPLLSLRQSDSGEKSVVTLSQAKIFPNQQGITFNGQSEPLAQVGLLVQSADMAFLLTAQADGQGSWEYFWSQQLVDGLYEVSPLWLTDDMTIVYGQAQQHFVRSGTLVSTEEYLNYQPQVAGVSLVVAPWSLVGRFALGFSSLAFGYWVWQQQGKSRRSRFFPS